MDHACIPVLIGSILIYLGRMLVQFRMPETVPPILTMVGEFVLAGVPYLLAMHGPNPWGWFWFLAGVLCFVTAFYVRARLGRLNTAAERWEVLQHGVGEGGLAPVDNAIGRLRSKLTERAAEDPGFAEACRSAGVDV